MVIWGLTAKFNYCQYFWLYGIKSPVVPPSEAEKMSQVAQIEYDRMIMQKEKQKQMSQLENEAHLAKIKSQADADYYLTQKQAESNKVHVHTYPSFASSFKF